MKPQESTHNYHSIFKKRRFGWGLDFNMRSKSGRFFAGLTTIFFVITMVLSIHHGKWLQDHQR